MSVEYRWGDGAWSRLGGLGGVDAVRAYLLARHPRRDPSRLELREAQRGGARPGAGRPKGTRRAEPTKTVAVRLTRAELERLAKIDPSPSKAIHALIADK